MIRLVQRRHEITRLEAFSDAIFGFAATLLVVSLDVPMEFAEMRRALNGFVPFALTFGTLASLWAIHNAFFRRYALDDRPTIFINVVLMFVVLFYVYPLKFLAAVFVTAIGGQWLGSLAAVSTDQLATMFMVYAAGWSAVFACIAMLYRHAWAQREPLALNEAQAIEARALAGHYAIFFGVGLLSLLVAVSGTGIRYGLPGLTYALLGPLCHWHWQRLPVASTAGRGLGAAAADAEAAA